MTLTQIQEDNLAKVLRHIDAECLGDVDAIVDSVAPDPRFFVLTQEQGTLELEVAETLETVREHYVHLHSSFDVVRSRQLRRVISDWFVFHQSVAVMRTRGDSAAERHDFAVDTAVLFPIAEGGILGEIPWNRTSFASAISSGTSHHEPPTEQLMDTVDLHETFLAAWSSGDASKVVDVFDDDCAMGIRSYTDARGALCVGKGKDAVRAGLAAQFQTWKPGTFSIVNVVVTDWYIFSNVRWVGEAISDGGAWSPYEVSTAMILPIASPTQLRAIIGYGTSLMPL